MKGSAALLCVVFLVVAGTAFCADGKQRSSALVIDDSGHTEENPVLYVESMREAISEAYHILWRRHYVNEQKDRKDDEAGMKMSRSNAGR